MVSMLLQYLLGTNIQKRLALIILRLSNFTWKVPKALHLHLVFGLQQIKIFCKHKLMEISNK